MNEALERAGGFLPILGVVAPYHLPLRKTVEPALHEQVLESDGGRPHLGVTAGGRVLTVTGDGIAKITVFGGGPRLVEAFGLPATRNR